MEDNRLITVPDKQMPNLVRVKYENGGTTPDILSGLYTGYTMAKKAIDFYEELKPIHEAQVYAHQKNISDEEEAKLFKEVENKVAEANKKLEAEKNNGKEIKTESKDEGRTEYVRKGLDHGSKSSDLSRERKPS